LQTNRELIKKEDGLAPLIKLIATNHPDLLVNVRSACLDPYQGDQIGHIFAYWVTVFFGKFL
jgi:hypothetical protein